MRRGGGRLAKNLRHPLDLLRVTKHNRAIERRNRMHKMIDFSLKILSPGQAEAVYIAMCALNHVGGRIDRIYADGFQVSQAAHTGMVSVHLAGKHVTVPPEIYENQDAFAIAYGLPT